MLKELRKWMERHLPTVWYRFLVYKILKGSLIEKGAIYLESFINTLLRGKGHHIDEDRKIIFFIISKNACSSLLKTFTEEKIADDYSIHTHIHTKRKIPKNKSDYFKFAFVRNPFDRVYSCYKSKYITDKKKIKFSHFENYLFGYLNQVRSFEEFVKKAVKIPISLDDGHFHSQYACLYKKDQCLVDYIGRFENLEKDFQPIQRRFKLGKLPHFNRSQRSKEEWKGCYTEELADLVYKKYRKDFDTWYPQVYSELIEHLQKNKTNSIRNRKQISNLSVETANVIA